MKGYLSHFISKHWRYRFYCLSCDKTLVSADKFKHHECAKANRHLKAHPIKKFKIQASLKPMEVEKRKSENQDSLRSPVKKSKRARLSCHKCNDVFDSEEDLNNHKRNVHFDFVRPNILDDHFEHTCEICYVDFTSRPGKMRNTPLIVNTNFYFNSRASTPHRSGPYKSCRAF